MNVPGAAARYLVITELFLPTKGGTAVWFDEVYRRIGDRGTHIVTRAVPHAEAHDAAHPNSVHRLTLAPSKWLRPAALPVYLKFFLSALWFAATRRFAAIHAGRVLPEGLVALAVGRVTRHRVVIYAHGEEITTWRRSPRRLRAMTFAYRHADKIIANSEFTRRQLLELGVRSERIEIIYPGIDTERFHSGYDAADLRTRIGAGPGTRVILSVGRLSRRKGFDHTIRAAQRLLARGLDVRYVLIGIGEDREHLAQLAESQGIVNRVHFLGHVPIEDLPRWYNACDVFAMPNRDIDGDTEGFGMVFLEAAACGKTALAGAAGGTGDAVIDAVTGLRVDGADVAAIESALLRLLTDAQFAHALAAAASLRARQEFDWSVVARKTLALEFE